MERRDGGLLSAGSVHSGSATQLTLSSSVRAMWQVAYVLPGHAGPEQASANTTEVLRQQWGRPGPPLEGAWPAIQRSDASFCGLLVAGRGVEWTCGCGWGWNGPVGVAGGGMNLWVWLGVE